MSNDNDSPAFAFPSPFITILLVWLAFAVSLFYTGTDNIWLAPALISVIAAGVVLLLPGIQGGWRMPRSPVVLLACVSWAYLAASVCWSTSPYVSELFLAALSFQPWLFLTLIMRNDNGRAARLLGAAMLAAVAVVAAGAVIQFLFFYRDYGPRIHYPFLDPNDLAVLLNIGLLPAVALFASDDRQRHTFVYGALCALFYAALIATQSRGGLICAAAGIAVLLLIAGRSIPGRGAKLFSLLMAAVIIPLIMQVYVSLIHGGPGIALNLLSHNPVSVTDRLALWRSTWAMIAHHPFAGTGLGTFYFYYSGYRLPSDHSDGFFAHMDALQLWSEAGIIAMILFYACYIAAAVRTVHAIKTARADQHEIRARVGGTFAAITAVFLHSHITFVVYLPALRILLGVLTAVWYADTEALLDDNRAPGVSGTSRMRLAVFGLVTIMAALIGQWAVGGALDVHYINRAAAAESRGDVADMRDAVKHAARFAPHSSSRAAQYEARWRALALKQGENLGASEKKKLFDDGMAQINRAMKLNPAFSYLRTVRARLFILGQQYRLADDGYDRAAEDLQYVLKADPLCLEARYMLAEIYKRQGEISKAKNVLGEGLNWPRPIGQPEIDLLANVALLCKETGDDGCYKNLIAEAAATARHYKLQSSK